MFPIFKNSACLIYPILLFIALGSVRVHAQPVSFEQANALTGIQHTYHHFNRMGGGAAFFDYDNDGWEDLWLSGGLRSDQLFHNNGDGSFSNATEAAGLYGMDTLFVGVTVITGDIDNDGDREVFVTTLKGSHNRMYLNNGDGTFFDISHAAGLADTGFSMNASFGDINLDGYLDIFVGNYMIMQDFVFDSAGTLIGFDPDCEENWFYLNNGDNTFTEISATLGLNTDGCTLASTWTDFDGDADCDLLVANDFGEFHVPNELHENAYPGLSFNDISVAANADVGMYGMGIGIGDYDHDLDLDYYVTNIGLNHLYKNNGSGYFDDATFAAGVEDIYMVDNFTIGWGAVFRDFDNDTWQDLYVSNGHIPAAYFIRNDTLNYNRLFYNNSDGTFTNIADSAGADDPGVGRGLACSDYDKDGLVDIVVMSIDRFLSPDLEQIVVYHNTTSNSNNWLEVDLTGTYNNYDAYGAQIEISVGGENWITEINGGSSHASQNSSIAHFGLGASTTVDEILVTWPGGEQQQYLGVAINQLLEITEDSALFLSNQGSPVIDAGLELGKISVYPNPTSDIAQVNYTLETSALVQLEIYDLSGKLLWRWNDGFKAAGTQTSSISLRAFEAGIYQIRLKAGHSSRSFEVVKSE